MKNIFSFNLRKFINRRELSSRLVLMALPSMYLTYAFSHAMICRFGARSCDTYDVAVVFPFYVLVTSFFGKINFFSYMLLYFFSSVFYLLILYYLAGWLGEIYLRMKHRPDFILKKV